MRIAFIGCGYVADYYQQTLVNHPILQLAGVYDRDPERSRRFTGHYKVKRYGSFEEVLNDASVEVVVNLTTAKSHYDITKAALEAGKQVYTEKPISLRIDQARELVELAEQRGLILSAAPCNLLSETAQTLWKALRDGLIATPRLAYAELDEGMIFENYQGWLNESGTPWPYDDEFETGCTLEHAAYYLGWLTAFFGPAKRVYSVGKTIVREKGSSGDCSTPDFAVGIIEFASGMVARITCSIYAEKDHRLRIFGDGGVLTVQECWDYGAPVFLDSRVPRTWREKHRKRAKLLHLGSPKLPQVRPANFEYNHRGHKMDFCRGIAELALAATEKRQPCISARWSLHVNEVALAISNGSDGEMQTTFDPITPMPWAR